MADPQPTGKITRDDIEGKLRQIKGEVDSTTDTAKRMVTRDEHRGIEGYQWAYDSNHLLYHSDQNGNEDFHLYSVDPEVKFAAKTETEKALRDVIGYRVYRDLMRGWRVTSPNRRCASQSSCA